MSCPIPAGAAGPTRRLGGWTATGSIPGHLAPVADAGHARRPGRAPAGARIVRLAADSTSSVHGEWRRDLRPRPRDRRLGVTTHDLHLLRRTTGTGRLASEPAVGRACRDANDHPSGGGYDSASGRRRPRPRVRLIRNGVVPRRSSPSDRAAARAGSTCRRRPWWARLRRAGGAQDQRPRPSAAARPSRRGGRVALRRRRAASASAAAARPGGESLRCSAIVRRGTVRAAADFFVPHPCAGCRSRCSRGWRSGCPRSFPMRRQCGGSRRRAASWFGARRRGVRSRVRPPSSPLALESARGRVDVYWRRPH